MGLKFRKSKKIAPGVRLNFSKRGVGVSFGGKRARYSISPTGRRTTSFKIAPGLTYSTSSGGSRGRKKKSRANSSYRGSTSSTRTVSHTYTNKPLYFKVPNILVLIIDLVLFLILWVFGVEFNFNATLLMVLSILIAVLFVCFLLINNIPPLRSIIYDLMHKNKVQNSNNDDIITEQFTPPQSVSQSTKSITISLGDIDIIDQAVNVLLDSGQASISCLQRKLKLGYARAVRVMEELEELGVVGSYNGSVQRQVLITREMWERRKIDIIAKSKQEPDNSIVVDSNSGTIQK